MMYVPEEDIAFVVTHTEESPSRIIGVFASLEHAISQFASGDGTMWVKSHGGGGGASLRETNSSGEPVGGPIIEISRWQVGVITDWVVPPVGR